MKTYEISAGELFEKRHDRISVITVEKSRGRILGLNITNRDAFEKTVSTGQCYYYDDVNDIIYLKGEHSGEVEKILDIRLDSCHARRHELHLLYEVEMTERQCKFGMTDCHFYRFEKNRFVLDQKKVSDFSLAEKFWQRITTLLETEEDKRHQKRFKDLK